LRSAEKGFVDAFPYSDVLSPRKACAVAKYLKAPIEFDAA